MIAANSHKYSISAMCKLLGMQRSTYYYHAKEKSAQTELENAVITEFNLNRKVYGTRKLKKELAKKQHGHGALKVSRRRIGGIMKKYNLISKYTLKRQKRHKNAVNSDPIPNYVERKFSDRAPLEVVVSDLTYVKCGGKWHYICVLLDLFSRKIIGSAVGRKKDAELVKTAFYGVKADLRRINIFHTDRGSEFKNRVIEEIIKAFGIKRSLSNPGAPIDNSPAESMYNIVKTEFVFGENFDSLEQLELEWFDYVNWYNHHRIHGSLGYLAPTEFERRGVLGKSYL